MNITRLTLLSIAAALALSGCGNKGPLVLPDAPDEGARSMRLTLHAQGADARATRASLHKLLRVARGAYDALRGGGADVAAAPRKTPLDDAFGPHAHTVSADTRDALVFHMTYRP